MTMKYKKQLCPFRKKVIRHFRKIDGRKTFPEVVAREDFAACIGERCMAYNDGKCMRMEKGG